MRTIELKYLVAYIIPVIGFGSIYLLGYFSFGVAIVAFLIIPILEFFTPQSKRNLTEEEEHTFSVNPFFDYLLYLHIPLVYGLLFYYFNTIQTTVLQTYETIGLTLSIGIIVGSFGINVGHELGHRANKMEQLFAKLLLLPALYMHFYIEHNRGHHKHVSTPKDPSSARKGENIYFFWGRSTFQSYWSAWSLEAERLRREEKAVISFSNEMIWFQLVQLIYLIIVGTLFGWYMIIYAILVAVIGFLLLETVNYIEHYGLSRKLLASGRYERVLPKHSWNSNHELGRIFLYELTRHSDHHFKADRKYQILRYMEESPQLPFGYPMSMLIALLPPVWFGLMDKRLPTT